VHDPEKYRQFFPITKKYIYLDHSATSPISTRALAAIDRYLLERSELIGNNWEQVLEQSLTLRQLIGQLINADAGRIAFVPNTNTGVNIVASGLVWQAGDEILMPEMEFPSNVYPYLNLERFGVKVRTLPAPHGGLEADTLIRAITPRTKLLALSFVEFLSGYKHDLKTLGQICKDHGILFIVDGIQGTGVIPMDVREYQIDALANGGHKWLMWSQGFGFLYVSKALQEKLTPAYGGWVGVENPDEFLQYPQELSRDARRYETGGYSSIGISVAIESLQMFFEIGIENIYEHLKFLIGILIDGLKEQGYRLFTNEALECRSGIVTFYPCDKSKSLDLFHYFKKHHVMLSLRENMLRISPHIYTTVGDLDRVLELTRKFINS